MGQTFRNPRAHRQRCGLPVTLAQMGVQGLSPEQLARIAALSVQAEDMATMPFTVTEEMVAQAIILADRRGTRYLADVGAQWKEDSACVSQRL